MVEEYKSAGWYPAPDGQGERWWNGAGWSDSRRGVTAPAAPTPASALPRPDPYTSAPPPRPAGSPLVRVDARNNPLATVALVVGAVSAFGFGIAGPVAVVLSLVAVARARQLKAQGGSASTAVLALIGLGLGVIGTIQLIVFFVAIAVEFGSS